MKYTKYNCKDDLLSPVENEKGQSLVPRKSGTLENADINLGVSNNVIEITHLAKILLVFEPVEFAQRGVKYVLYFFLLVCFLARCPHLNGSIEFHDQCVT